MMRHDFTQMEVEILRQRLTAPDSLVDAVNFPEADVYAACDKMSSLLLDGLPLPPAPSEVEKAVLVNCVEDSVFYMVHDGDNLPRDQRWAIVRAGRSLADKIAKLCGVSKLTFPEA